MKTTIIDDSYYPKPDEVTDVLSRIKRSMEYLRRKQDERRRKADNREMIRAIIFAVLVLVAVWMIKFY